MTQMHRWALVAVLALAGLDARAQEPAPPRSHPTKDTHKTRLVRKTYPVRDLISVLGDDSTGTGTGEVLVRAIRKSVKPASWSEHGGSGTIAFDPGQKVLVVRQTSAVHQQVAAVLKAVALITCQRGVVVAAATPPPVPPPGPAEVFHPALADVAGATCSVPAPPAKAKHKPRQKQYGHFVMDNLKINAQGVTCTVKRVRFMYRGDGIESDVAKCALTGGESEKKEVPPALAELLEKLQKADAPRACLGGTAAGALVGPAGGLKATGCCAPVAVPPFPMSSELGAPPSKLPEAKPCCPSTPCLMPPCSPERSHPRMEKVSD
jgi:hypothetical protein